MIIKINTSVLGGLAALPVEVEVQVQNGLPRFSIIGLADNAVKESRERVLAALSAIGCSLPDQILVNLAPAEMRKVGAAMDMAMAIAVAVASGAVSPGRCRDVCFVGELGLDGIVKPVRGAIAHALCARKSGLRCLMVPMVNYREASLIEGIECIGITHLQEALQWLEGAPASDPPAVCQMTKDPIEDIGQIIGQDGAKRALQIAATGRHHMLMVGPPGCGKTMLARSLAQILPSLSQAECLEVAGIHSIAGQPIHAILEGRCPFRAPHYGVSEAGLIGGGSSVRPGEITLAHRGVLFLDEFPEFNRCCLEALRIPLEHRQITVSRSKEAMQLPASFQLIAAMNPCPCGTTASGKCRCSEVEKARYVKKLSQPILDRIDIHVGLHGIKVDSLLEVSQLQDNADVQRVRKKIEEGVQFIEDRYGKRPGSFTARDVQNIALSESVKKFVERLCSKTDLSARAVHKVIKVAVTIAAMRASDLLSVDDVAEAASLRT